MVRSDWFQNLFQTLTKAIDLVVLTVVLTANKLRFNKT